ncbi:MAG: sulfotransferase [Gammaproteobacteria bacterium]|nr:sulfotransferase [Gammaproteobacteria bacterium]
MPNNFPNAGFIAALLLNAKIIDARRHPLDACLSCWRQLFVKGQNFIYDLTEIGEYYLQYQRMMDHWTRVLPGRVLTVQYEEVIADFDAQVRQPIYDRSVSHFRHYEHHLGELIDVIAPIRARYRRYERPGIAPGGT